MKDCIAAFLKIELYHCMDVSDISERVGKEIEGSKEPDPKRLFKIISEFYDFLSPLRYSVDVLTKFSEKNFAEKINECFVKTTGDVDAIMKKEMTEFLDMDEMDIPDAGGIESLIIYHFYNMIQQDLNDFDNGKKTTDLQILERFFDKPASITEKRPPDFGLDLSDSCKRLIKNKQKRYAITGRAEFWNEAIKDVIPNNKADGDIQKKVESFLKDGEKSGEKDFMSSFIILLLIKYHFILHSYSSAEFRTLGQHIEIAGNRTQKKIKRAKNIFTFTRLIAKYFPNIFATSEEDSKVIAKGIEIVSYIRRGFAYEQLNEPAKAFNDYTSAAKCASIMRDFWAKEADRQGLTASSTEIVNLFGKLIVLYTYALKGEIYRKEHAYYNAHQYFCALINKVEYYIGKESDKDKTEEKQILDIINKSLKIVRTKREKGKTFLELGEFSRGLKWYLKSLWHLVAICNDIDITRGRPDDEFDKFFTYFEAHRHDPKVIKSEFYSYIKAIIEKMGQHFGIDNSSVRQSENPYAILFSDLCNRISLVIYLLNLPNIDSTEYKNYATEYLKIKKKNTITQVEIDFLKKLKGRLDRNDLAHRWVNLALNFNKRNSLAQFNELIFSEGKNISNHKSASDDAGLMSSGGSRDIIYRQISRQILEKIDLMKDPDTVSFISKRLFRSFLINTDTFSTKNAELYQYLMKPRIVERSELQAHIYFHSLQRWSSINPALPRPSALKMKGGGYFIVFRGKGIAIDPGINFIENLYSEGFSIVDIDYIIVTHDHIDHTADIDAIMSLHYRRCSLEKDRVLHLIANPTVSARYSFMVNQSTERFKKMELTPDENERKIFGGFSILPVKVDHADIVSPDLGSSIGLKLIFTLGDNSKEEKEQDDIEFTIGITGDTKYSDEGSKGLQKLYECDMLIAHINSASFRELKAHCKIAFKDKPLLDEMEKMEINKELKHIIDEIEYSYGYKPTKGILSSIFEEPQKDEKLEGQHLFLTGVLKVYEEFIKKKGKDRLFVIAETTEEMGSYRQKVAAYINEAYGKDEQGKDKEDDFVPCITSDIGMSVRIGWAEKDKANNKGKIDLGVKCSRCNLNNDNTFDDIFHKPRTIKEVCLKREEEGIFYFCPRHDPESINRPVEKYGFIERLERYQPYKHIDISVM